MELAAGYGRAPVSGRAHRGNQTAGGRRDRGILRRSARGRHQKEPQPCRRVRGLAPAPQARQEHSGLLTRRRLRRQTQEYRPNRRLSDEGVQQPALAIRQKKYMRIKN